MTVKELLHQKIEDMSQDEARLVLDWLEPENEEEFPPLTPAELAVLDRALEQERRG